MTRFIAWGMDLHLIVSNGKRGFRRLTSHFEMDHGQQQRGECNWKTEYWVVTWYWSSSNWNNLQYLVMLHSMKSPSQLCNDVEQEEDQLWWSVTPCHNQTQPYECFWKWKLQTIMQSPVCEHTKLGKSEAMPQTEMQAPNECTVCHNWSQSI